MNQREGRENKLNRRVGKMNKTVKRKKYTEKTE